MAKNKKAWIRIAEAAFAILMLASIVLVLIGGQAEKQDIGGAMYNIEHAILEEASRNDTIRNAAISNDELLVGNFVKERLPAGMNFTIRICGLSEICDASLPEKEVYVDDVLVSSTIQTYLPKKVRLFVWIE